MNSIQANRIRPPCSLRKGFTLVELLVVVAIIAILAAIGVVNLVEAQKRAKVTRAKADMRTAAGALEAYCVDHAAYPYPIGLVSRNRTFLQYITELSTPVAYLTTVQLDDPFKPDWKTFDPDNPAPAGYRGSYSYYNYFGAFGRGATKVYSKTAPMPAYSLTSVGPDRDVDGAHWLPIFVRAGDKEAIAGGTDDLYDSTNGTTSNGDIVRFGGESPARAPE